jgi:hypothetical protein
MLIIQTYLSRHYFMLSLMVKKVAEFLPLCTCFTICLQFHPYYSETLLQLFFSGIKELSIW